MTGTPPTSQRRFGNYDVLALIGRGGMAEVFRARVLSGPRQGQLVAIKRLLPEIATDPDYVKRFTTEADLSQLFDHPNIVKVYDVGVIQQVYYIAMELVDGRDLGQVLRRCKQRQIPLPVDFAVYLAKVLLEALSYAHHLQHDGRPLGLVHCDVSPSNLFISRLGEIKLGDFGVALVKAGRAGDEPSGIEGKPYYVSPELLNKQVSVEADLWAANVTLYELLTGERPFVGKTPEEVFEAVRQRRFLPAHEVRPEVSAELSGVISRGFAQDPAQRFAAAAEFAQALEPHYNELVGTPLAIGAVVRGLFGATGPTDVP